MTHLLDTDHLSILQYPTGAEYPIVTGHLSRHRAVDVAVCVVSIHEQVLGANALIHRATTAAKLAQGYEFITRTIEVVTPRPVLPFDDPAAALLLQLRSRELRISSMDLRIAAVALSRNLVVVTRNARDFGQVPGLVTEDWTK